MNEAAELVSLSDWLWLWQAYDPAVKSDLFSSAAMSAGRLFLIDPIPLAPAPLAELAARGSAAGVLVTNANHPRAAAAFARHLDTAIFAAEPVAREFGDAKTQPVVAGN